MARNFNGSTDVLTCSPGSAAAYGTLAAICYIDSLASIVGVIGRKGSGSRDLGLTVLTTGVLDAFNASAGGVTSTSSISANKWYLLAFTKGTGTVTPTMYALDIQAGTWAVDAEAASGTLADFGTGNTAWYPGHHVSSGGALSRFFSGEFAVGGFFPSIVLTKDQLGSLAYSLQSWYALGVGDLWVLDQQATGQAVADLAGGGANQSALTGTAVSTRSVPVFTYGASPPRVQRFFPITTTVTPGAASLTLTGSVPALATLITPASLALALAGSTPGLITTIAPSALALILSASTPAVVVGTFIVPGVANLVLTSSTPALSTLLTPTSASLTLTGSTPALTTLITPSALALLLSGSTPTITNGAITVPYLRLPGGFTVYAVPMPGATVTGNRRTPGAAVEGNRRMPGGFVA